MHNTPAQQINRSVLRQRESISEENNVIRADTNVRKLRKMQYHYNKRAKDFPLIKEGSPVLLGHFTSHKRN